MPNNFANNFERVKRRQRRRQFVGASCSALCLVGIAALVLVGLDRLLGIHDLLGRVLWTTAFSGWCVLAVRQWMATALSPQITLHAVARRVEGQHPELRDLVTSGLEFSGQSETDPWAGSSSLRRAVVVRATTAMDDVDWQQLVPRRPMRRAVLAMVGVLGVGFGLAWWAPQALGIGFARLLNPLAAAQWPRLHNLQFVNAPQRLAAGDDLVLVLRDTRGPLPKGLTMHYRTWRNTRSGSSGRWLEESVPLVASGRELTVRRRDVQKSLEYRVTGGDHQNMPWQRLEVVAAPQLSAMQIKVHPPTYTGLPPAILAPRAEAIAGSLLELQGRVNPSLARVLLCGRAGQQFPVTLAANGQSFHLQPGVWRAEKSDSFTLQLTTRAGVTTTTEQLLALDVRSDAPPEVRFLVPSGDMTVVPEAEVLLVIIAEDDLAVHDVDLVYRTADQPAEGDSLLPLLRGPAVAAGNTALRTQQVEFLWTLAPLGLAPGSVVEIHAQASDYRGVRGQTRHALRLAIVSPRELLATLRKREARVLDEIERLLAQQRAQRASTGAWAELPEWSPARWAREGHVALFRQRQIAAQLIENPDSVLSQLAAILSDFQSNGLERPETTGRLQELQRGVRGLAGEPLTTIDYSLSTFVRQAQAESDAAERESQIARIARFQDEVIAVLERALGRLALGALVDRFERELHGLLDEQVDLAEHCHDLTRRVLLDGEGLVTEEIDRAATGQRQLARRLADLMRRMSYSAGQLSAENPAAAGRVDETVALARQLGVQAVLLQAADQVALHRLGRAAPLHRQAEEHLRRLLRHFAGRDAASAAKRIARMQEVERELQLLRRQLATIARAQLEKQTAVEPPRQREQRRGERLELAGQAEAVVQELQRLHVLAAADATRQAAASLRQEPGGAPATQRAAQQLEEAERQLAGQRRREQVALARFELARLGAVLAGYVERQEQFLEEIKRFEQWVQGSGQLTTAQQQRVRRLAEEQAILGEEIVAQADQLVSFPVYVHLLRVVGHRMQHLSNHLRQQATGDIAGRAARQCLEQLRQLAEAVKQEKQQLAPRAGTQGQNGGEAEPADPAEAHSYQVVLGQLKLLKSLQLGLQQQTRALELKLAEGPAVTQSIIAEASKLAERQRSLTRVAEQLQMEATGLTTPKRVPLFPQLEEEFERP